MDGSVVSDVVHTTSRVGLKQCGQTDATAVVFIAFIKSIDSVSFI